MPDTTPSRPAMTMREIRDRLGHARPDTTPTTPAVWSEGDPLMEAMAAAVYEQCASHPEQPLTVDDPRTIAAVAATVARLVLGTTDQQPATTEAGPETMAALMATIRELHTLQQPLVDGLRHIRQDMDRAHKSGDEWATEWMGQVWLELPLQVRAAGGDTDAAQELADEAQQPETEAHPAQAEWIGEVLELDGAWEYLGASPDRSVAERRRASITRRHPNAQTRTVRKVTTYTVAADQPDTETEAQR
ncbi:hypothetical protein OG384_14845 [Streptomyces sp. NBC_01324]|uniref:hypothetical protein n=1 Tax=Streptomyces sp. NBC_01324 TaxID=2903826 RepID=UPI002E0F3B16|nr:hypothetical protein OG384_14845 [Streptomyces sp. NBC_01324]